MDTHGSNMPTIANTYHNVGNHISYYSPTITGDFYKVDIAPRRLPILKQWSSLRIDQTYHGFSDHRWGNVRCLGKMTFEMSFHIKDPTLDVMWFSIYVYMYKTMYSMIYMFLMFKNSPASCLVVESPFVLLKELFNFVGEIALQPHSISNLHQFAIYIQFYGKMSSCCCCCCCHRAWPKPALMSVYMYIYIYIHIHTSHPLSYHQNQNPMTRSFKRSFCKSWIAMLHLPNKDDAEERLRIPTLCF